MRTFIAGLVLVAFVALGQNVKRIDQYSARTPVNGQDLLLIEDNLHSSYWTQTRSNLNAEFVNQAPNFWSGPTNVLDMNVALHNNGDLYYITSTPMQITNVINEAVGGSSVQTVTLTILNVAATNVTIFLPSFMLTRDGLRSYTVTNGQCFILSARYHPSLARLNAVSCPNF